jgi:hypothetical protein
MKKLKIAAIVAAMMILICGCSEKTAEPTCADVTSAVMSQIEIPSAAEKTVENIGAYYGFDTSTITDMSVFICASGAYPDEIAVFRFTDGDAAKEGLYYVNRRILDQTETFEDYTPEEMYKLENPVIKQYGNYIIYCALSDNVKAYKIVESIFKP